MMSNILHKGQNIYNSISQSATVTRGSSLKLSEKNIQLNLKRLEINFRRRSVKLPGIDDYILGEEIFFDVFGECLKCKNKINLEKICEELSCGDIDKNFNRFKCKCGDWNLQKLNFKMGTELYNQQLTSNHSSLREGVILYSPTNLKKKLLHILSTIKDKPFDVDNFRLNYPEEFWNSVWYFKLKEIDISFMLPYITPVCINKIKTTNNINNFLKFTFDTEIDNQAYKPNNIETKNPNTKIKKMQDLRIKFNNDLLFIQKVHQMSILKIVGMVVYKPDDNYRGNIDIKGNVLKGTYCKKRIGRIEKKNKNKNDNIIFSNNLLVTDFDMTISTNTSQLDKGEDTNNKTKEVLNIYENDFIRKTKIIISNEDMFEHIKEDDENFYKFKDYMEDENAKL